MVRLTSHQIADVPLRVGYFLVSSATCFEAVTVAKWSCGKREQEVPFTYNACDGSSNAGLRGQVVRRTPSLSFIDYNMGVAHYYLWHPMNDTPPHQSLL